MGRISRLSQWLLFSLSVSGQTPTVLSVVNYATGDARFSPGALIEVQYQPENSFNSWTDSVHVGGQKLQTFNGHERGFVAQLPFDLPLGRADIILTTPAVSSAPFTIAVDRYAPGLIQPLSRSDRPTRISPFSCVQGQTAKAGEIITAFAVGLGPTVPAVSAGHPASMAAFTVATPIVTVGGKAAELVESALVAGEIGLYRIRFVVPPGDGWQFVRVRVGDHTSNLASLPVGAAMLNVSSATPINWVTHTLSTTTAVQPRPVAPESLVTAYACGIHGFASRVPGVTTVSVRDSAGTERPARVQSVDGDRVNYLMPADTASGIARVIIRSGNGAVYEADLEISRVAPAIFEESGLVARLRDGMQTVEPVKEGFVDMGRESDEVYLVLFGTGIRFRSSLVNVSARITGGEVLPIEYAGPHREFPGLDQVNIRLPRSLAGRGTANLELNVDGIEANVISLRFQ